MISQRDYYLLSVDIFKTLSLNRENRPVPAKDYLEKSYNTYTKLIESSSTLSRVKGDKLIPIDFNINDINENNDSNEIVVLTPKPSGRVDLSTAEYEE
jgi:hypothetical protein